MFLEDFGMLLRSCSGSLSRLLAEQFTGVSNAFVLVRVWRAPRADVGRYLSHHLLVVTTEDQVSLLVDLQLHAGGQQYFDGVRIAQGEGCDLAFDVGAVAGASDIQLA